MRGFYVSAMHCDKQVTIPDTQNAYYEKEKEKARLYVDIAQLLHRIQHRRNEHEDENASGYANNAIVDRTRSLQNDDRACSD